MDRSSLPEAKLNLTRGARLRAWASYAWRVSKRSLPRLAIMAMVMSLMSAGVYGAVFGLQACNAQRRARVQREAAKCVSLYNGVRVNNIMRLQAVNSMDTKTGEIYLTAWRVYAQPPGSAKVDIHDNGCYYSFVADVPADEPMWAIQSAEWRSERCMCWMEYHVRSMSDPAISTVEREYR